MNTVQRIGFAGAAGADHRAQVPLELLIIVIAIAGPLLGALTDIRLGAAVTIVVATVVTLRRMRAEVLALRAWDAGSQEAR